MMPCGTPRPFPRTATACSTAAFLSAVLAIPRVKRLLSQDHFSVDGTPIQAWASMKSFRLKDDDTPPAPPEPPAGGRNGEVDFHGQRLSNDTHRSTTDPEARLYRKGQGREAKLSFMGHALMEHCHGLIVDGCVMHANGHAERTAALAMIEKHADRPNCITLGADKGYDAQNFVNELRSMNVTPHIARNTAARRSALDGRTTRHPGYALSQRLRKRIEEGFGWGKEFGLLRRIRMRGRERVDMAFAFSAAACNLVRLPKLLSEPEGGMKGRWKDLPHRNRAAARLGARGVDAPKPDPPMSRPPRAKNDPQST